VEGTVDTQEITLSLPTDVLRKVRRLAAERQTSVAELQVGALERLVQ
jgi:hypothetical protein